MQKIAVVQYKQQITSKEKAMSKLTSKAVSKSGNRGRWIFGISISVLFAGFLGWYFFLRPAPQASAPLPAEDLSQYKACTVQGVIHFDSPFVGEPAEVKSAVYPLELIGFHREIKLNYGSYRQVTVTWHLEGNELNEFFDAALGPEFQNGNYYSELGGKLVEVNQSLYKAGFPMPFGAEAESSESGLGTALFLEEWNGNFVRERTADMSEPENWMPEFDDNCKFQIVVNVALDEKFTLATETPVSGVADLKSLEGVPVYEVTLYTQEDDSMLSRSVVLLSPAAAFRELYSAFGAFGNIQNVSYPSGTPVLMYDFDPSDLLGRTAIAKEVNKMLAYINHPGGYTIYVSAGSVFNVGKDGSIQDMSGTPNAGLNTIGDLFYISPSGTAVTK